MVVEFLSFVKNDFKPESGHTMKDVLGVIFSRDRAMQLDAVLRSLFLHCQDIDSADIWILYKTTDLRHEKQYQELIREYSGKVFFKKELDLRQDLSWLLSLFRENDFNRFVFWCLYIFGKFAPALGSQFDRLWRRTVTPILIFLSNLFFAWASKDRIVFLLVDDNLFVRDFYLNQAVDVLSEREKLLGFSFRLGKNTTYSYAYGREQSLPEMENLGDEIALFDWTKADGDFGYPLEVSSSVYRLGDFLPLLMAISFDNPNTLEDRMAFYARDFKRKRPLLACYQRSVTFCNPINLVQSVIPNRAGETIRYSVEELSSKFEQGERVRVDAYSGFIPNACHQEVELIFEGRGI